MLLDDIRAYRPFNEQEREDKEIIVSFLENNSDAFWRSNKTGHMTASAWIVNKSRDRVLMVYHNLYKSWSWTGGHADGEEDLLKVALKEAKEETGADVKPVLENIFSLEILTVDGHEKKGEYVPSHLHFNLTYLLEADESDELKICPDENSAVAWFGIDEALKKSTEPWLVQRIYKKLNEKMIKSAF